jgi:hypothetical protein
MSPSSQARDEKRRNPLSAALRAGVARESWRRLFREDFADTTGQDEGTGSMLGMLAP